MKRFYVLIIVFLSLALQLKLEGQVYSTGWGEGWESMTVGNYPNNGWLTNVGGFSVEATPHAFNGINAISKRLSGNSGPQNEDSLLTPKCTGIPASLLYIYFSYRICNWTGSVPTSSTTLGIGDTMYISVNKYQGSNLIAKYMIAKRDFNNHSQNGTNFTQFFATFSSIPITQNDTLRYVISVKRGLTGDYWYDIDDFMVNIVFGLGNNLQANNGSIFPNPTKNNFFLHFNQNEELNSVSIKNNIGQEVFFRKNFDESKIVNIDISELIPGIYFAEILLKNGQKTTTKLVKD